MNSENSSCASMFRLYKIRSTSIVYFWEIKFKNKKIATDFG